MGSGLAQSLRRYLGSIATCPKRRSERHWKALSKRFAANLGYRRYCGLRGRLSSRSPIFLGR